MFMDSFYLKAASLFQAMADPTRLELLRRIEPGECCASELHTALAMSQPRVARHLKILVDAGLLSARRDGRFVRYLLTGEPATRRVVLSALALLGSGPGDGNKTSALRVDPPGRPTGRQGEAASAGSQPAPPPDPPEDPPRGTLEDFLL